MEEITSARLGAQLWLERDSSPERIERLVRSAAGCGLGLLRVFMVWPWIEPEPKTWDFALYDAAFDAAARHGVRIKATLGPDTAPWHAGTPGFVQSGHVSLPSDEEERIAIGRYLRACVERYRDHPALAQWILWNEPFNSAGRPGQPNPHRSATLRGRWSALLRHRFGGDLGALNRRWHTGYASFEDIPFPEDIPHPAHRSGPFFSFDPWLADFDLRAEALRDELAWVHRTIRELDPVTPTCFNLPDLYRNHAELGYDFTKLATSADVLGASVHAPWHLGFTRRARHIPLLTSAVRMLRATPGDHDVELTEVQFGNVYQGSPHPYGMTGSDLAGALLAPLLAGATSVTGWCLNSRQTDFEAGDWALLDDDDRVGPRAATARRVAGVLADLDRRAGSWTPARPEALVLFSEHAQAVSLTHSWTGPVLPGRAPDDAIQGVGLICAELLALGVTATPAPVSVLDGPGAPARLLVASALGAYEERTARALLRAAEEGSTLVLDGITGHKDLGSGVHRPWPGGLGAELGLRASGFATRQDGHPMELYGAPAGRLPLVRTDFELTADWRPDLDLALPDEGGKPLVWRRGYGQGQVVLFTGPLGPALVHDPASGAAARRVLTSALGQDPATVRALSADTVALPVHGERADAVGVFAPDSRRRGGGPLRVAVPAGRYHDLWSGARLTVSPGEAAVLDAPDGIALLVTERPEAGA